MSRNTSEVKDCELALCRSLCSIGRRSVPLSASESSEFDSLPSEDTLCHTEKEFSRFNDRVEKSIPFLNESQPQGGSNRV